MTAAEMRERVTFQARQFESDGYGNTEGDFADEFTVAARIRPRLGGEAVLAARLEGRKLVTITVRHSSDTEQITTDWRAKDARTNVLYNIRSIVNPDEHKHWLEILAEQGVAT